jgi:hypothetical protein
MSKKVLITVGPIPARLDSVKFLTNRFKGGLALKTAQYLADAGNDVTIVAWKFAELNTSLPIIRIDDVVDYYNKVLAFEANAYILAAAVANLMPSNPYEGKFPSHKYQVGEKFNIEFEIAPRVIDEIKKKYPRSTLIGYKLYDGTEEDLIAAAKKTLFDSTANIVFANNPKWAKERKIVLTQDGAIFDCNFDEHLKLMNKVINEEFYSTTTPSYDEEPLSEDEKFVVNNYPTFEKDGRTYGTFAVKRKSSFITTTRGKKNGNTAVSEVYDVNHSTKQIAASEKATLNAPLLAKMFELNPSFTILLHGHELIGKKVHDEYEFAGSTGDLKFACQVNPGEEILLTNHGNIVGFENIKQFKNYIKA